MPKKKRVLPARVAAVHKRIAKLLAANANATYAELRAEAGRIAPELLKLGGKQFNARYILSARRVANGTTNAGKNYQPVKAKGVARRTAPAVALVESAPHTQGQNTAERALLFRVFNDGGALRVVPFPNGALLEQLEQIMDKTQQMMEVLKT